LRAYAVDGGQHIGFIGSFQRADFERAPVAQAFRRCIGGRVHDGCVLSQRAEPTF